MNTYYVAGFPVSDELYHHGILGQKWGVRRYQNPDGTLTAAGKARYGTSDNFNNHQELKKSRHEYSEAYRAAKKKELHALSPSSKEREKQNARIRTYHEKGIAYNNAKDAYSRSNRAAKPEKLNQRKK